MPFTVQSKTRSIRAAYKSPKLLPVIDQQSNKAPSSMWAMGHFLYEPVKTKYSEHGQNARLAYGASTMQGWRNSQEDAHNAILDFPSSSQSEAIAFFAVYDGHSGTAMSEYAERALHRTLVANPHYAKKEYRPALRATFITMDDDIRAGKVPRKNDERFESGYPPEAGAATESGCTANVLLVVNDTLWVANAGDSRAVLCRKGVSHPLSKDHKPTDEVELRRIKAAKSLLINNRVNGQLDLSRSLGDLGHKYRDDLPPEEQAVTCVPDILEMPIGKDDEFVILACDGIWGCFASLEVSKQEAEQKVSSQQVCNAVRWCISQRVPLDKVCECLMDYCLQGDMANWQGKDNMTLIIVALLQGRSLDEWYDWVAERVESRHGYSTPKHFKPLYKSYGEVDSSRTLNEIVATFLDGGRE